MKAREEVDKTVIALAEYIQDALKSNVADPKKDLPALVSALAQLTGNDRH